MTVLKWKISNEQQTLTITASTLRRHCDDYLALEYPLTAVALRATAFKGT